MISLCSSVPSLPSHLFLTYIRLFPWGTLNLAACANYFWKEAHSHNHQFQEEQKSSWASLDCAPFLMKDGRSTKLASREGFTHSMTLYPSSDQLLMSSLSQTICIAVVVTRGSSPGRYTAKPSGHMWYRYSSHKDNSQCNSSAESVLTLAKCF